MEASERDTKFDIWSVGIKLTLGKTTSIWRNFARIRPWEGAFFLARPGQEGFFHGTCGFSNLLAISIHGIVKSPI